MLIQLDDVNQLTKPELESYYKKHYNDSLYRSFKIAILDTIFVEAKGTHVYDEDHNEYLDFYAGFGALNLGHNPQSVIDALNKHFNRPNLIQENLNIYNGILAHNISYLTDHQLSRCHFTTSGTETVEEAIKLSQMAKEGAIVYCTNAYHGKTLGSISALGDKIKHNYSIFKDNFILIPYGDLDAFKKTLKKTKISAFLVEPIQAEGGIILPPAGYFNEIRDLCDKHDITLIFDEIQTGLGRCGSLFYYQELNITPDILCISKSLSGGIIPVGCMAVQEKLWNKTYGKMKHAQLLSTTFGGNTFSCIAAIETLNTIVNQKLSQKSKEDGIYFLSELKKLKDKHAFIQDVRGAGLLIGIELNFGIKQTMLIQLIFSTILSKLLNEHHILVGLCANNPNVLKVEPALIISRDEIDVFVKSLDQVLDDLHTNFGAITTSLKETLKGITHLI